MVKWPLDKAVWDIWTLKVWANRNNIAESDGLLRIAFRSLVRLMRKARPAACTTT